MTDDPDRLVAVASEPTEFAANVKVAVLADAGIEAKVFGSLGTTLGASGRIGPAVLNVDVQVRASDAAEARRILASNIEDSVDIDWDSVDVGNRVDSVPLTSGDRMPLPAIIAACVVGVLLVSGIVMACIVAIGA